MTNGWKQYLAQWSHQLSEVNEQLLSCHSWKIKRLHCKTIPPAVVNWMPILGWL